MNLECPNPHALSFFGLYSSGVIDQHYTFHSYTFIEFSVLYKENFIRGIQMSPISTFFSFLVDRNYLNMTQLIITNTIILFTNYYWKKKNDNKLSANFGQRFPAWVEAWSLESKVPKVTSTLTMISFTPLIAFHIGEADLGGSLPSQSC